MINPPKNLIDNAVAKILVPLPDAVVCFISIQKKDLRAYPGTIRTTEEWG